MIPLLMKSPDESTRVRVSVAPEPATVFVPLVMVPVISLATQPDQWNHLLTFVVCEEEVDDVVPEPPPEDVATISPHPR